MRGLRRITAGLFVVSSLFPIVAACLPSDPPRWLGMADVVVAAALAGAALTFASRTRLLQTEADLAAGFRLTRVVAGLVPVLLILFFVAGHRMHWDVLVIGLAWRAYLLVLVSPFLARRPAA